MVVKYNEKLVKIFRGAVVFMILATWIFSGWPQILNFPPKVPQAQAAVTYVGGASATGNSADFSVSLTGLTGGSGSAAAAGDLVIVVDGFVSTSNGNPGVSTAGYTEVADLYASDSDDANLSVNWKIMGGTPDTSVTCLGSTSASWGTACVVQVWRGINYSTPLDVTTTTAVPGNNVGTSVPNAPAITPVTSGAIVLAIGVGADAAADTAVTAPTGYSNQVHASVDPSLAVRTSIASKAWSGSGAEDPAVWTGVTTTTAGSWAAATLAIRPATIPNAPTIGTATAGNTQASITFTPPANDGGSVITGYTVTSTPGSFTGTGSASPIVVTGLTNGTAYTFTVHATNAIGNSSESSASNSITPATIPTVTTQAAGSVEATTATCNGTITATGGVNSTAAGCEWDIDSGAPYANNPSTAGSYGAAPFTQSLTSLPTGTTIYARAFATNSAGTGYGGEVNFLTKPAAPTSLNFTSVTATTLRLNWTASTGAASYKVERCTGTGCSSWSEIAIGVTNAYYDDSARTGNTVYRYQVRATNATGDSAYSSGAEQLMLSDVPSTPTFSGVAATSITVNWNAPTGGAASYKVERAPDSSGSPGSWAEVATGVSSPWTNNTGLSCNTTYWYKVRGTNGTGDGSYSGNNSQLTGSCNSAPSFSGNPTDSPDPVVAGYDVTFSGTANDSESNSWYLVVCKTNSVTPGAPPTCAASQTLCVSSSAVATGNPNTCTWTSAGSGAQDWYAFACDNNASPTCSSANVVNSPVTVNTVAASASVSPATTSYGIMAISEVKKADTANANDEFIVTNNGNVAADFDIISSDAVGGSGWTLSTTAVGSSIFMHAYSTLKTLAASLTLGSAGQQATNWVAMDKDPNYRALASNVAVSGTVDLVLELLSPSGMGDFGVSKDITVTIRATQH